jgi:hypothetical protein
MSDLIDKGRLWLFENSYWKNDKHPVFTGNGEISVEVLKKLVADFNEKKPENGIVLLQCAGWQKNSKTTNKPYTFITFELKTENRPNESGEGRTVDHSGDDDIPF